MVVSRHQNGQNHNLLTGNKSLENYAKCKHLGTAETNQNQFRFWECLSPFSSESLVFPSPLYELKI